MPTESQDSFQRFSRAAQKGAQCPSCFTFNLLHHLPEKRKQHRHFGIEVTCALCGTRFPVEKPAPALNSSLPLDEKGAA
jgi:hypothetical protein